MENGQMDAVRKFMEQHRTTINEWLELADVRTSTDAIEKSIFTNVIFDDSNDLSDYTLSCTAVWGGGGIPVPTRQHQLADPSCCDLMHPTIIVNQPKTPVDAALRKYNRLPFMTKIGFMPIGDLICDAVFNNQISEFNNVIFWDLDYPMVASMRATSPSLLLENARRVDKIKSEGFPDAYNDIYRLYITTRNTLLTSECPSRSSLISRPTWNSLISQFRSITTLVGAYTILSDTDSSMDMTVYIERPDDARRYAGKMIEILQKLRSASANKQLFWDFERKKLIAPDVINGNFYGEGNSIIDMTSFGWYMNWAGKVLTPALVMCKIGTEDKDKWEWTPLKCLLHAWTINHRATRARILDDIYPSRQE